MILNKPHRGKGCLFACLVAFTLLINSQTLASTTSHTQDTNTQNQPQSIKNEANISFKNSELQKNITESLDKISHFEKQLTDKLLSTKDRDKIMKDVKKILEQLEELSKSMKLNSDKITESDRDAFNENLKKIQKYLDVFQREKTIDKKLEEFTKAVEELSSKPFPLSAADRETLKMLKESIAELRKNPFENLDGEKPNEELQQRIAQKTKSLEDSLNKIEGDLHTLANREQTDTPSAGSPDELPTISQGESQGHSSQSSGDSLPPSNSFSPSELSFNSFKTSNYNSPPSNDNRPSLNSNGLSYYSNVKKPPELSEIFIDKNKEITRAINPNGVYNPPREEKPMGVFPQKNSVPAEIITPFKVTLLAPQPATDSKSNRIFELPSTNSTSDARNNPDYATAPKFVEESSPSRGIGITASTPINETYTEPVAAKRFSINTPNQYTFNRDGTLSPIEESRKTDQNSPASLPNRALASLEATAADNPQLESVPTKPESEAKTNEGKLIRQILASSESYATSDIFALLNKSQKAFRKSKKTKNNSPITAISSAPPLITKVLSLLGF